MSLLINVIITKHKTIVIDIKTVLAMVNCVVDPDHSSGEVIDVDIEHRTIFIIQKEVQLQSISLFLPCLS